VNVVRNEMHNSASFFYRSLASFLLLLFGYFMVHSRL